MKYTTHLRGLHSQIDWNDRLIGILGARGTGKTTLLLQHLEVVKFTMKQFTFDGWCLFYKIHTPGFYRRFQGSKGGKVYF
jgi:ABC-type uncharacterized transport system ATPase subunit